jgi:hypothetical protein
MPSFRISLGESKGVSVAVSLALLAACSTLPNSGTANFSPSPPKQGFGAVYVGRPFGGNVSVFPVPVELDGRPLASLGSNDYTRVEVASGRHKLGVPEGFWTRAINGIPHAVDLTIESGKSYYLLPTNWGENEHTQVVVLGNMAVPEQTADAHSSFSVQTATSAGAPPPAFLKLSYVAPAPN